MKLKLNFLKNSPSNKWFKNKLKNLLLKITKMNRLRVTDLLTEKLIIENVMVAEDLEEEVDMKNLNMKGNHNVMKNMKTIIIKILLMMTMTTMMMSKNKNVLRVTNGLLKDHL